jgi:hypothetical protein
MAKAVFVRRGNGFYPVDDEGHNIVHSVPEGKECMGEFAPRRNVGQHRLFFALLNLLVENDVFENIEAALLAIKIATGEWDAFINSDGRAFYVPRSLAFESMDGAKFKRFFDRALHIIMTKYLDGSDEGILRQQVLDMTDNPDMKQLGKRIK